MAKRPQSKPSTWEDLRDGSNKTKRKHAPLTWRARLRIFWIWTKWTFAALLFGALCYGGYYLYENTYIEELFSGKTERIKHIEFKTDGVVTGKWLNEFLKIEPKAKLSDVNIFALKQALESMGQIKSATIERVYPDTLRVIISEYKPFLRIAIKVDYQVRLYSISPDGFIFQPICHSNEELEKMPFIEGYTPIFKNNEPKPFVHARKINEFLEVSRNALPQETAAWKFINVSQLDSMTLPLITVIRTDNARVIFAPADYKKQLDRLDYILRYAKDNPLNKILQIDLSLKDRADVKLEDSNKK